MVNNYSFDGIFYSNEEQRAVDDPLRYWIIEQGSLESGQDDPLHKNSRYGRVTASGCTRLMNLGFNGLKEHIQECAISIKDGHDYFFECWLRPADFQGTLQIQVTDGSGHPLTTQASLDLPEETAWTKVSCTLKGTSTAYGKLEISFQGNGAIDLDCISFLDADYWHKDDPKWKYGKLRKDLIQALADLKPTFMRFPGGCIVEGQLPNNEYNWKDTVGELYERKSNYNLWSEKVPDGGYNQSYQIGFYEYLCPHFPVDSEEFQTQILDNYLDLLDFANGDPQESKWAALRAQMGHPEPFGIDRIGIGNENYGEVYFQRFDIIEKAIHAKYPEIICVLCGGIHPYYEDTPLAPGLDTVYDFAKKYPHVLVDEHSYHTPEWFAQQSMRFDHYDREGAGVYFGEYAANGLLAPIEEALQQAAASGDMSSLSNAEGMDGQTQDGMRPMNESNQLNTALGEAAFLTGVERNSDLVAMTSYAPLFNLVESDQWNHNLINFNPWTLCLSTNYYVQKIFASRLGIQYLPYTGTLPEHTYLSATEDENHIYLKLVNTGANPCRISLELPCSIQEAQAEILQSDNPHCRNDLTFQGEAVYHIQPVSENLPVTGNKIAISVKPYAIYGITAQKEA